jgi:hypothetical protein
LMFVVVLGWAEAAKAEVPACPPTDGVSRHTSPKTIIGDLPANTTVPVPLANATKSEDMTMYPCDTFWAKVTVTTPVPGGHWFTAWANRTVNGVVSAEHTIPWTLVYGSLTAYLPMVGNPHGPINPGTRDSSQIITDIQLKSWTTSGFSYSVELHVDPRKDLAKPMQTHNIGGLTWPKATIGAVRNGDKLNLSMPDYWVGGLSGGRAIYYRFTLAPGGQLYLNGTVQNSWAGVYNILRASVLHADAFDGSLQPISIAGNMGDAQAPPNGSASLINNGTLTNTDTKPRDFFLKFLTDGNAAISDASITATTINGTYAVNSVCKPEFFAHPAWTGTSRRVGIHPGLVAADRVEIEEAITKWNAQLSALGVPMTFLVDDLPSPNILVRSTTAPQGSWEQDTQNSELGNGWVNLPSNQLNLGKGNLVQHMTLHEFGHVLRMSHVNPVAEPVKFGVCTGHDSLMWTRDPEPSTTDLGGPFPGITANEVSAVQGHWFP